MDNKKSAKTPTLKKPHHYGKRDGVHLFHATMDEHKELVGKHIKDPSEDDLKNAIEHAKKSGVSMIVIHGAPPESLRSKIHPDLGILSPSQMAKTDVSPVRFDDLQKAFTQPDQQTFTDIKAHVGALAAVHPKLMEWGTKKLSSLPKDAVEDIELDGKTIKVRKLDTDLYSGWVEKDGNKLHSFERITLPELMTQLQSKLELYGKEDQVVEVSLNDLLEQLKTMVHGHFKEMGHEYPEHEFAIPETKKKLADLKEKIDSKLTPVSEEQQAEQFARANAAPAETGGEHQEVVPKKELVSGLIKPAPECQDCGSNAAFCDCYTGLPRPRLEFDGQKVTVFFKSEWANEDRENFLEDLKLRAGQILKSKHIKK